MASVLVIDPQDDFTSPLADALRQKGHVITTVSDGREGLNFAVKERPDAIVLSVEQRGMNGLSICSRLRRDDLTRTIPLVLVSADASSFATHRTSKSKADAYMAKPFSAIELLGVLTNVIDQRPPRDTISDLDPPRLRSSRPSPPQPPPVPPSVSSNGQSIESTADLLASDLPLPRDDSAAGGELDWMVKLRQSIARRDTQIADLRAKVEEAVRLQSLVHEKDRRHQEEIAKISRERDETVKANMSMQEKLTSTRLDLDDTKKRFAKEKKALEEKLAQVTKQGEDRLAALKQATDDTFAINKKQADDKIGTLTHQLEDMTQREANRSAALEAANKQIKSLTQKLDDLTRNYETSKKTGSELKSVTEKQGTRIVQLEDELARTHAESEQRAGAIGRLEDQVARIQGEHTREVFGLKEDLKAAEAGSDAKSKTIMMRDEELAKQKANYEKRLASQDDALRRVSNALDAKVVQHTKDLEARDASIHGLKQKVAAFQSDMTREKTEHDKLLEVAADVHAKEMNRIREELQNRASQNEQQHREALKKANAEKEQIEAERSGLETQAVDLGKRLATTEKQLSLMRQQLSEGEKRAGELLEKLTISDGRVADLERRLSERTKNRQQLVETLAELGRLVDTARDLGSE